MSARAQHIGTGSVNRRPHASARWLSGVAGVVALVLVGAGIWAAGRGGDDRVRAGAPVMTVARERALSTVSGCLVTGSGGVSRGPASVVWKALQDTAAKAGARASFLPVLAPSQGPAQVNALVAQHCTVVVGVDKRGVAAVNAVADRPHPGVSFAVAGSSPAAGLASFEPTISAAEAAIASLLRNGSKAGS